MLVQFGELLRISHRLAAVLAAQDLQLGQLGLRRGTKLGDLALLLVGQRAADFLLDSEDAGALPFTTRVPVEATEIWLRAADRKAACLSSAAVPLADPGGEWLGARGVCRDVTPEHAPEGKRARPRKTPTD